MKLRRQLFTAFLIVSIVPLIIVSIYLFGTNVRLAFDLYTENLYDSTEIQTNIINEKINRFMLETTQFASSNAIEEYFASSNVDKTDIINNQNVFEEIFKFTKDTLDSGEAFGIVDNKKNLLYVSGANNEVEQLNTIIKELEIPKEQVVFELPLGEIDGKLIIATPIKAKGTSSSAGMFITIYNSDYFLKSISGHRQIASSTSFIYCMNHHKIVESKRDVLELPEDFYNNIVGEGGNFTQKVNGVESILSYMRIQKTEWILINTMPESQVFNLLFYYGIVSLFVFVLCLIVILMLSSILSKRVLLPFENFLKKVEGFFASGASVQPPAKSDKKTEIGYLEDKFVVMATGILEAQNQLKESNYLYEAILHATYDFRIEIDIPEDRITASIPRLEEWFDSLTEMSAKQKLLHLFKIRKTVIMTPAEEDLRSMLESKARDPIETEACLHIEQENKEGWFRIIAVPILDECGEIIKVVLHFENITNRKVEMFRLLKSSQRDSLCGLLNKQALINLEKQKIKVKHVSHVVFFIDLDNFKMVNDCLGHAAGDQVLIDAAHMLVGKFRETDFVARYGGDEFVVYAPGMTKETAARKAQELVLEFKSYKVGSDQTVQIAASVGVVFSRGKKSLEELIQDADSAMYQAKQRGKSQYFMMKEEE